MNKPETARLLRITGRVQGVWFRAWAVEQANALGVVGWVRNRSDGSVETLAAGPRSAVEAFVERCRHGPPAAGIDTLEVRDANDDAVLLSSFAKRPTL